VSAISTSLRRFLSDLVEDSMTEKPAGRPGPVCDLGQRKPVTIRSRQVGQGAQYRSDIPELSGFGLARCASDADRCWSLVLAMRDNGQEAMCSMPVTPARLGSGESFPEVRLLKVFRHGG
jgi:hypothetical protein